MLRAFACAKFAILALIVATPTAALGASAAQEISSYNKLTVEFTKNAQKCGFESLEPFERNLKKELLLFGCYL